MVIGLIILILLTLECVSKSINLEKERGNMQLVR